MLFCLFSFSNWTVFPAGALGYIAPQSGLQSGFNNDNNNNVSICISTWFLYVLTQLNILCYMKKRYLMLINIH